MQMMRHTSSDVIDERIQEPEVLNQVAALCTRRVEGRREILLVKSSRGRWILPKGWPMDDRTDAQAAKLEAWEEAGVLKGSVSKAPIARFMTKKRFDDGTSAPCFMSVFSIAVKSMTKSYPEAGQRRRRWVSRKKAVKMVSEKGLKAVLRAL